MNSGEASMNDYRKVIERLRQEAEKIGLHMETSVLIPTSDEEDTPVILQGIFTITDVPSHDTVPADDPLQQEFDKQFEALIQSQTTYERKSAEEEVRSQLEDDFKNGKGIFGD